VSPAHLLIDGDTLEARLSDAALRVYDCTTWLRPDPPRIYRVESGRADFEAGHIPGADFLDLAGELADPQAKFNFMMPAPAALAASLGSHGIGDDSEVVLYSRNNIQWATRVWWIMRAIGFDAVSVLDGGLDKWQAEGRPVSDEITHYPAASLTPRPRDGLFCDSAAVLAAMEDPDTCVINALRASLHDGSDEVNYGRPGRIPGSVCVPALSLLDGETKAYRPLPQLESLFAEAGALAAERVVIYCGGGIAATSDAFTLTRLGQGSITIYDASMSEWANDPSLPMESG
jgi:thiosulfate/3-mercaptopyruvate sulfurtransferase